MFILAVKVFIRISIRIPVESTNVPISSKTNETLEYDER
jgi:hypothetical protein